MKLKPWYVTPIIINNMCCCHYYVKFELYYDTFLDFGLKKIDQFYLLFAFRSQSHVKEQLISYFTTINVLLEINAIIVVIRIYFILITLLIRMIHHFQK